MRKVSSSKQEQEVIQQIAGNLGISIDDLWNDPGFRAEVGADELDRVEAAMRDEDSEKHGA